MLCRPPACVLFDFRNQLKTKNKIYPNFGLTFLEIYPLCAFVIQVSSFMAFSSFSDFIFHSWRPHHSTHSLRSGVGLSFSEHIYRECMHAYGEHAYLFKLILILWYNCHTYILHVYLLFGMEKRKIKLLWGVCMGFSFFLILTIALSLSLPLCACCNFTYFFNKEQNNFSMHSHIFHEQFNREPPLPSTMQFSAAKQQIIVSFSSSTRVRMFSGTDMIRTRSSA